MTLAGLLLRLYKTLRLLIMFTITSQDLAKFIMINRILIKINIYKLRRY